MSIKLRFNHHQVHKKKKEKVDIREGTFVCNTHNQMGEISCLNKQFYRNKKDFQRKSSQIGLPSKVIRPLKI